jgi:hypothetical protein
MAPRWDIGPLTDRELDVLRDALQAFVQARSSIYTANQREVAGELDQRCLTARRVVPS